MTQRLIQKQCHGTNLILFFVENKLNYEKIIMEQTSLHLFIVHKNSSFYLIF